MTVVQFVGKPRTGKTYHMTFNAYGDYIKGRKIYSVVNPYFELFRFEHTILTVDETLALSHMKVDRNPKTMCIQEADKIFDARRSGRKENVLLSDITGQSGKRNTDILYDTQFPTRVDKSLRDVTDTSYVCNAIPDVKNPIAFEYTEFDGFLLYPTGKRHYLPAIQAIFDLYDSYQPTQHLAEKEK